MFINTTEIICSGVAIFNNCHVGGKCSYNNSWLQTLKQSISKEINCAEYDFRIFAPSANYQR